MKSTVSQLCSVKKYGYDALRDLAQVRKYSGNTLGEIKQIGQKYAGRTTQELMQITKEPQATIFASAKNNLLNIKA